MRDRFSGYYRPQPDEFNRLWTSATIVADTNVLLNLYRYSQPTAQELLKLLRGLKDRLWLPYRCGFEFHRRRGTVVLEQAAHYEDVLKRLQTILDSEFKSKRKHPFISEELLSSFEEICGQLREQLTAGRAQHQSLITNDDPYLEEISELFSEHVGNDFSPEELEEVIACGQERYDKKIPPGYCDQKKSNGADAYGDYIVWRQILDHAKSTARSVILVTDDAKEDWWLKPRRDITIGPRPELIEEFQTITQQRFYMYSVDGFMTYAAKFLGQSVPASAIAEVEHQRALDSSHRLLKALADGREVQVGKPSDLKPTPQAPSGSIHLEKGYRRPKSTHPSNSDPLDEEI